MTSVDRYAVHMTILSPMGRSIFACFRFRYRFNLWGDLLRENLDLSHCFVGVTPFSDPIRLVDPNLIRGVMLLITLNLEL